LNDCGKQQQMIPAARRGRWQLRLETQADGGAADRCHVAAGETQQNQQPLRVFWGVDLATIFNDLTKLRLLPASQERGITTEAADL
jgi:hypothetical protein